MKTSMFHHKKANFPMIPPILPEAREMGLNLILQRYQVNFVFLKTNLFLQKRQINGLSPIFRTQIIRNLMKL